MDKPFLYLNQQIQLLRSRGMCISDYEKARIYLLHNNYYNVINMVGKLFLKKDHTEYFLGGTSFDELTVVHFFDKEVKSAFLKSILVCECRLRSLIAFYFSQNHPNPNDCLDVRNYDQTRSPDLAKLITDMNDLIIKNLNYQNDNAIKHYKKEHGFVPLWVLINFLEFGKTQSLFNNMLSSEKNQISRAISENLKAEHSITEFLPPSTVSDHIETFRQLRNILAHDNKIIGFKTRFSVTYCPNLHGTYNIRPNDPRQDVYSVMVVLKPYLSKTQYAMLHNTIRKRAMYIEKKLTTIGVNSILNSMGFPTDWHKGPKLPQ